MKKSISLTIPFVLTLFAIQLFFVVAAHGQQPTGSPPVDGDVVRITTSLIRLDAVVTRQNGEPVTDLKKEDFQVLQDGKLQRITSAIYVGPRSGLTTAASKRIKNEIEAPPSNVRSGQGRLITFVLDDGNCLATVEGNFNMRVAMKKFVDEQMQAEDRVAIYNTKGGSSLLQMYTSNKDVLRRKISKIGLLAPGGCNSAFEPYDAPLSNKPAADRNPSPIARSRDRDTADITRDTQLAGTIGVLDSVLDRLQNSPQRKEIFLLSEGLASGLSSRSRDALRELADKAARSSVVVHTFSTKGVTIPDMIRADERVLVGPNAGWNTTDKLRAERVDEEDALNAGLAYLAYTTGGRFVSNQNSLEKDIAKILNADQGYYLIAYEPDDETFKSKDFHKIEIGVNRPDLKVTSRKGFFGHEDVKTKPTSKTADSDLFRAVSSPFVENGIDLRLTLLSGNTAGEGNYLRALFHIRGEDVQLMDDEKGGKKFSVDVVAVVLDEKAKVVQEFNRTYSTRIPPEAVSAVIKNGLDFSSDMLIGRPGVFSYRVAIRDNNSKRLGSAGDFFELPESKDRGFFIAGLTATTIGNDGGPVLPQNRPPNASFAPVLTKASPAVRQFKHGDTLVYAYTIYNAEVQGSSPTLTRQIRLFRDGKLLLDTAEKPIAPKSSDLTRISDLGNIRITDQVALGEYALQVIVRDRNSNKISEQSIDFEVID